MNRNRKAKKYESLLEKTTKIIYLEKLVALSLISIFLLLIILAFTDFNPIVVKLNTSDASDVYQGIGIGGLLSIFAIVISLALMAVQFASQQYTHRIMDFYTKSMMFRCILFIYMGTIFYNMYVLMEDPVNPTHMFVSISLSALCIIALIPHFFITMIHLRPDFIISKMLGSISEKDIDSLKNYEKSTSEEDKLLLPIAEIVERAIRNGDRTTARRGLDEIKGCYLKYLNHENEKIVSPYFLKHILNVGRVAIINEDDGSMGYVLNIFGEIGRETVSEKMNFSSKIVLEDIDIIGFKVLHNYDAATEQMIKSLQDIVNAVIESGNEENEILMQIFNLYNNVSDELFNFKKDKIITYTINSFSEPRALIAKMVKNKRYETIEKTAKLLVRISVNAVKSNYRDPIDLSISLLHEIGISSAKNKLEWKTPMRVINIADLIVEHLLTIEREVKDGAKTTEFNIILSEIDYAKSDIERYLKDTDFIWPE
jgi:hypothetical protein